MLRSALLQDVPHGFSTREGLFAHDIAGGGMLLQAKQVHSAEVVVVTEPWDAPPEADALVSGRNGLVLGIVTADCAPVLLADPEARVIGAAHAGWRGALGGVIGNTVAAMVELGARRTRIRAAIGPCIAQSSYEVDEDFRAHFAPDDSGYFEPGRAGHWQFDLPGYVAARLRAAGIATIDDLARDTYADAARFHSYRRAMHAREPNTGRQTSVIALRA